MKRMHVSHTSNAPAALARARGLRAAEPGSSAVVAVPAAVAKSRRTAVRSLAYRRRRRQPDRRISIERIPRRDRRQEPVRRAASSAAGPGERLVVAARRAGLGQVARHGDLTACTSRHEPAPADQGARPRQSGRTAGVRPFRRSRRPRAATSAPTSGFDESAYLFGSRVRSMNPTSSNIRNFGVPGITLHEARVLHQPQTSTCRRCPAFRDC